MHVAPSSAASRGRAARTARGAPSSPLSVPARGRFAGRRSGAGTPTKRRPSSSYWPGSGVDGASSIGSVPDWVFGKAMTSRMFVCCAEQRGPAVDAERDPAVRRRAVLEGVEDGPELLAHALERVALEQERALEQVAAMDPDGAAAELPAVEREVVLQGPRATGRVVGRRPAGSPDAVISSASSSGTTPLNGLWVASQRPSSVSHWYIGKRWIQT